MSQGLLQDEPGDRETAIQAIREAAFSEDTESLGLASQVALALRATGVVLAAAATADPEGKTAKERLDRLERRSAWWDARVKPLLNAAWKNLGATSPDVAWDYQVTPAFPAAWPSTSDGELFFYAYPVGRDLRCNDAIHVLAPWVRVVATEGSAETPKVISFPTSVVPGRLAPLRPRLTFHEHTSLELRKGIVDAFEAMLRTPHLPDEGARGTRYLRDFYSIWNRKSLVRGIRRHHEPFFRWLGPE